MTDPIYSSLGFDGFSQVLCDTDYDELTNEGLAKLFGVTSKTISNWKKKTNWEEVKEIRRKKYAPKTMQVDDAVFKAAKKGDIAAAKLWYERFDGYVPSSQQITVHDLDEGLIDDELKHLSERRIAAAAALAASGSVDPAGGVQVERTPTGEGEAPA